MNRLEKRARKFEREYGKREAIGQAIMDGMARSERMGYTKPKDVACFVKVSLDSAGFAIVRKRKGT